MKLNQTKNYLKLGILLFGISILIIACQNDETETFEHDQGSKRTQFSTIDFKTFKTKIQCKDISDSDINNLIHIQQVPLGQLQYTTQSESQNFVTSIDSTDVLVAEKNGITSYTFKTRTTDMSKTTNYVLAHDDENLEEFYIKYEDDGSVKIIDPTSGYEVTTQSTGSSIWCPYAEVVQVCADCGSTGCNFEIWGSVTEIIIHYEPCPTWNPSDGGSNPLDDNGSGEPSGGQNSDGSPDGNYLPLDGPISTKPLEFESEEEIRRRRECNKIINMVNAVDQTYMNKVKDLKNKADLPFETTVTLSVDETINEYQGEDNTTLVDVPLNPPSKYIAVSHVHNETDSVKTYSVPSLGDLVWIAESLDDNGIRTGKFVAFLTTADGTYFALTLKNSEKLKNYFNYRNAYRDDITPEQRMQYFSELTQEKSNLMKQYYLNENGYALIKEDGQTNIASLTYFMQFLDKADLGVEVFKTNENFDKFQQVKLNDSGSVVYEEPCQL